MKPTGRIIGATLVLLAAAPTPLWAMLTSLEGDSLIVRLFFVLGIMLVVGKFSGELFERLGYRRTSVDEVARQAGVAKGTVYLYFKTKADLLVDWKSTPARPRFGCQNGGWVEQEKKRHYGAYV